MSNKILITGAGGAVGLVSDLIIKHLVAQGQDVRAFMRPTNKKDKEIEALGVEVFKGDLLNLHDVVKAVQDVDIVYFSMSLNPYYSDAYIIIMEACRRQGKIKALINLSEYEQGFMGYDEMVQAPQVRTALLGGEVSDWSPQQRAHWVSERALEWSGVPYVNIHANAFIENPILSWFNLGTIASEQVFEVPFEADEKVASISAPDLAEAVANIISNVEAHIGKSYALTGDELLSMAELAQIYSDIFGFKVTHRYLDKDAWAEKYMGILRDNNQLHTEAHLKGLMRLMTKPVYQHTTDTLEKLLGHKPKGARYALENLPRILEIKKQLGRA